MINPSQDSVGSLVPCRRRVFSESDESNRELASLLTDQSIATLFEARVAAHPQKIALQTHEREFTYSEINEAANGLASGLLKHVGGRSGPVAIWLEDGFAVATSLLATWKAGKAFLAGNLQAPDAYNRTIFSVAAPVVIVAEERFRVQVEQLVPPDTVVLIWEEIRANPSSENPNIVVPPEALLRIVFTSGSTGVPKGVEHDQQGMLREAHAAMAGAYYRSDDRFLQLSSLSHVNGSDWLFYVFMMGATLSYYPLRLRGVEGLEQWVAEKQITRFVTVPTVFRHFVRLSQVTRQSLASVLIVHLGGEPVRPDDVRRFKALFPAGAKLIANIGSTEAGSFARCIFNQDTPIPEKSLPLGRAHPGIVIQLWDEFENRVSDGSTGEIVVGSRGVARGYFQQPDLTARVFRQDASAPRLRWFKTGDLAWYDGDGILHSAGRKDRQVKIRGHRVELPEIEAVIADHPMIDNVVVKAWLDESQGTRLVAYYSSSGSVVVTGSTLLS